MKLLRRLIFCFGILLTSGTYAQQQEIVWTQSLENKGEIYPIGEDDGHFYIFRRTMFHTYLEKTNIQTMEMVYSEKMEASHPDAPTKIVIAKAIIYKGIINLFGITVDQKSGESVLWASSIKTDGIIIKKWSSVHTSNTELSLYVCDVKMSPNGVYFSFKTAVKQEAGSTYKLITINKDFNKVSEGEIMIPEGQLQGSITCFEVNNSGHVFALVGREPLFLLGIESNSIIPSKSKGINYDPGKLGPVTLYTFDGVKERSIALNKASDRITLLTGTLNQDSTGSIMYMTGLYSNTDDEKNLKGTYLAKLRADESYPNFTYSDLGEDFAKELVQKDLTFKHKKDLAAYQIRQTLIDRDGNILILGEFIHYEYYCWSAGAGSQVPGCTYQVNWNSIFIVKISNDGTLLWKQFIPKKSSKVKLLAEMTQSFAFRNNAKGTDLIFLDAKKNMTEDGERLDYSEMKNPEKTIVLLRAHIDNNGDITYSTFLILSNKSKTPYFFKGSWQIGDAILIDGIDGMNSLKQYLGRIDLK